MSKASLLSCALTLFPTLAAGQTRAGAELLPLESIAAISIAAPDLAAVAAEDAAREAAGLPPRFAIPHAVALTPANHGTWEDLGPGRLIWRLRVLAPGALNLNLGFGAFALPEGAELSIHSADLTHVVRPFTAADNEEHGQLWTPVVASADLVVELAMPAASAEQVVLELAQVGYGYRGFEQRPTPGVEALSGACNVDVICPEGDPWRLEIPSVGVISVGGSTFCSGFLVNNVRQDFRPYFMTANHCGVGGGNAGSLVVYWNYENSFCRAINSPQNGQPGNGQKSQFNTGAFWRASHGPSDFTLVELDDAPNPSFELSWAGWDATGANATSAVAIHHPQTQEKRISFENQPTTTTSYLSSAVPGNGTHVCVTDWDLGTTEGGSSGSPLFNQDHQVIGQLHGGFASCTSQTSDWYGKLSVSWTGGGTPSSSLRRWLDPDETGTLETATLPAACPSSNVAASNGSGVNPMCLVSLNEPIVGGTWQVGVDTSVVPGATFSGVRLFTAPALKTVFAGELLVNVQSTLLASSNLPASGGLDVHTIDFAALQALAGQTFYLQGGIGAGSSVAELCNSEVVLLGCQP